MFLGILGVGHLATTIVSGLLRSGFDAKNIILSPRGKVKELSDLYGIRIATDNASLVDMADVVLLAVRPMDAAKSTKGLPWRKEQIVISACAGVAIENIPVVPARVVRAMPLTAAAINASPTACFPPIPDAVAILKHLGPVIALASEADFEVATVNAAVYGWVQDLIRQTTEWCTEKGLSEPTARQLIANTFIAAGRLIDEKPDPVSQLLSELVTPGGITELGLNILSDGGQPAIWRDASEAVLSKLTEKPE
ncbi:NAD(P)-binding domain-containing protein [Falsochrobactrum sp. TDYN1]|uniref:NAD(P)-binding domain-containing protein n=1 Tax=Falsochrobactrum tianjinense TaxID=2706015 RepID=A0A949PKG8_9HYPH|nr:NAD(P)-binding domain-containing protein [Falsochrobactrum sp. TDYN1]MBV2142127.1 NAD(P)-binding domain-containing protein [Falsochrobactrum sp. TDYN1]